MIVEIVELDNIVWREQQHAQAAQLDSTRTRMVKAGVSLVQPENILPKLD